MEEDLDPRFHGEPLPDDFQDLLVVSNPSSRSIGVGAFECPARRFHLLGDLPTDAADDAPGSLARRVEGIERVENGGRRAAEKRKAIHD